jgi:hypothetical protein
MDTWRETLSSKEILVVAQALVLLNVFPALTVEVDDALLLAHERVVSLKVEVSLKRQVKNYSEFDETMKEIHFKIQVNLVYFASLPIIDK